MTSRDASPTSDRRTTTRLPSLAVAENAFETLGHRPEEMIRALSLLDTTLATDDDPNVHLPSIAATLRSAAADVELERIERLGGLAQAVFAQVATAEDVARGIISVEAAARYSAAIGREVRVENIQPVVNELLAMNLVMRRGHGRYGVSDPFVRQRWQERIALVG